ncbi:hypothetical protein C0966_06755 [Bacillus methanolicus]|uniref:hypothetical protein n=1 Tax=Bacillus methanolicus TaxID=1471 RepID=UPI00237FE61C|nr:hypothetical protein [Bacillus methanolicus]MDE3839068.1 hypothetical protein [Bacillus methanolicus]
MGNNNTIAKLANIFVEHGIYSKNRFASSNCPLRVFQKIYPEDVYSKQIEEFLRYQPEHHSGNGADLPWWGNRYFTDDKGIRIMIVGQDSRTPNGGSVTFYMPLLKDKRRVNELRGIINSYSHWDPFVSFELIKEFFEKCNLNYDFGYVTDAQKVENNWEELFEREIEIVNPDVILCLGNRGLTYLLKTKNPKITKIVDKEDTSLEVHQKALVSMPKKPIIVASLFPSKINTHNTDERERNVISTLDKVIRKLEGMV